MDFLQGEPSGKREMFESLCGLNRIKLPNSRETGSKTTVSARTGELCLLRSLNRVLYTMRK